MDEEIKINQVDNEGVQAGELGGSIYLRIIEAGLKYPKGFSCDQFMNDLTPNDWERKIVNEYLETAYRNYNKAPGVRGNAETPFLLVENGLSFGFAHPEHKYIVSYDAHFKYIDYQELRFARENAREARSLSITAILISVGAIIIPILVPLLITQTVSIDESSLEILSMPVVENSDLQD